MNICPNPHTIKLDPSRRGASPVSRRCDPALIASTLTPEQRRQQAVWRCHARAGDRWIKAYLGDGPDAEQAHRFLDRRLRDVRYRLLVGRLHALGKRPTAELLLEVIGGDEHIRDDVFALLERYTRLTPAEVHAVGADAFPPTPLHAAPNPQGT